MARTQSSLVLICPGNPGPDYAGTRHNAGFLFADYLAQEHDFGAFEHSEDLDADTASGRLGGMDALLVKPLTTMNKCGNVVGPLREQYPLEQNLWAIAHDDLDLSIGSVKGRQKGGHGGHNGVRSILGAAGRKDIVRIKLGVSSARKVEYSSVADFLLSEFHPEEREKLQAAFPEAEEILLGQIKSYAAQLEKADRRAQTAERYRKELLEAARDALKDVPAASPFPVFLNRQQADRVLDVAGALAKIVRRCADVMAEDGELCDRLRAFIPEDLRPLLPDRSPTKRVFFAADMHVTEDAVKVVELNCAVGYGHYADLAHEALGPVLEGVGRLADARFAPFLYEHGLKPLHDAEAGCIAFLRGFNGQDMFNVDEIEGVARHIEEAGGPPIALCHEGELSLREDGLYLEDSGRVDLLYVEENLSEWSELAEDSPVLTAVRGGKVKTFPPLDAFLYTSKGFLSVLADPGAEEWLQPGNEERRVLRENILWSHPLDTHIEPAAYYMLQQGLRLVVKDSLGGGGRGVTILRPGSGSQQASQILRRRRRRGGSVVQGYFEAGRWSGDSDLRFDVRVLMAAHRGDVIPGPVYGRVFRGSKLDLSDPDAGVAPVYVVE